MHWSICFQLSSLGGSLFPISKSISLACVRTALQMCMQWLLRVVLVLLLAVGACNACLLLVLLQLLVMLVLLLVLLLCVMLVSLVLLLVLLLCLMLVRLQCCCWRCCVWCKSTVGAAVARYACVAATVDLLLLLLLLQRSMLFLRWLYRWVYILSWLINL